MTDHTARLYSIVGAVLVFFVAWALIAAHPWRAQTATVQDPRVAALQAREQQIRAEGRTAQQILDRRWAVYRAQLGLRKREIAALQAANARVRSASLASVRAQAAPSASAPAQGTAPSVRVVTLPPLTVTRTS